VKQTVCERFRKCDFDEDENIGRSVFSENQPIDCILQSLKAFNDSVSYGYMVLHAGMECLSGLQDIELKKCTAEGNNIPRE